MKDLDNITALAQTPDQLIPYVSSVSGMKSQVLGEAVLHQFEDIGVLVAFSPKDPCDASGMNEAVEQVLQMKGLKDLTVLGPEKPLKAPGNCQCDRDFYWGLALDKLERNAKLRNTLKRASRDIDIEIDSGKTAWTEEHMSLCDSFCSRKKASLGDDSIFLFGQIGKYLEGSPQARVYSARDKNGKLKACAVADFSAFATAFYMFAFRYPDAVPGSSDLLLDTIINDAASLGYEKVNLGLGIDRGVEFFKKKWGAHPLFPYVESKWKIKRKSWLYRLMGGK